MDGSLPDLPERLPFSKQKLPKKVIFSYILDYLIIVVLIAAFYALDAVNGFRQHFSLQNYTLHYPYAVKERVPVPMLVVYAVAAPAVIIAVYTLVVDGIFSHQAPVPSSSGRRRLAGRYRLKDRLWELNCGILGLMLGVGAAFTITGALKNAIGKPRPDLVDRCQPNTTTDPPGLKLSTSDICTQKDNAILKDGFRSFPSGHSSTAFAGLFFLSIYLAAKLHVLDSKGEVWKTFIVMVPTLGAALIAGSRIMDARHHPFDVITGSLLGILCAWGAYRQYFPPVSETWRKGRAYPIRSWGREPVKPESIRIHSDTEPLRAVIKPSDAEGAVASGYAGTGDEQGGNVFRQQIHASQRRREEQGAYRGPPSSAYSFDTPGRTLSSRVGTYQNTIGTTNPFERGRTPRNDDYYSSSSEDESSYEMQPTHRNQQGAYDPVNATYTDTSYHPQLESAVPAPLSLSHTGAKSNPTVAPIPESTTGDLGETSRSPPPPVPPHAAGTTGAT